MNLDNKEEQKKSPTSRVSSVDIFNSLKQNIINANRNDEIEEEEDDDNYRDKNREEIELRKTILDKLSPETASVILENDEKMEEIIEGLRKKGLSKEEGVSIAKFKSIAVARSRNL